MKWGKIVYNIKYIGFENIMELIEKFKSYVFCALSYSKKAKNEKGFIFRYPIVKVNRVYDGDTFWIDFDMGFNMRRTNEKIRVLGCDAFELKDEGGPEAKAFTEKFLSEGDLVLVTKGKRDSFGRILGTIEKNGVYLDDELRNNNLTTDRFIDTDIIK